MKITNLTIYKLFKKKLRNDIPLPNFYNEGFIFFKLNTSENVYGLGEPNPYLGKLLLIERRLEKLFNKFIKNKKINQLKLNFLKKKIKHKIDKSLINSFESAIFDIIGKYKNQPVCEILAKKKGSIQKKIDLYASGGTIFEDKSYDTLLEEALYYKDKGFSGWKFRPKMPLSNKSHSSRIKNPPPFDIKKVINFSSKLRKKVGDDFNLMFDVGCRCKNINEAKYLIQGLEDLNFSFIEEPLKRSVLNYKKLFKNFKKKLKIGLGEHFYDFNEFNRWLNSNCFDIVQPDSNLLLYEELRQISNVSRKKNKRLIFHNWCNPINISSNFSFLSSLNTRSIAEYNVLTDDFYQKFAITGFKIRKGKAEILNSPGLGVDLSKKKNKNFVIYEKKI